MKQKSSVKKSLSDFTERKTISMGIKMKKVLSLLLMLAMLMGMSVTSFAAETSNNVEPQSNLRVAAPPITSLRVLPSWRYDKTDRCIYFVIEEMGTGPGSVTLAGTKLIAYKTDGMMNSSNTYAIGWRMYYKSQKIYNPGVYKMNAVFNSTNGTPKIWNLNYTFNLTEENFE